MNGPGATTDWLVRARPRRAPLFLGDNPSIDRLLDRWQAVLGPVARDAEGDAEDFLEDAFRLDATLSALEGAGLADHVFVTTDGVVAHRLDGAQTRPADAFCSAHALGPTLRGEHRHVATHVDAYSSFATFLRHAGRPVRRCTHDSERSAVPGDPPENERAGRTEAGAGTAGATLRGDAPGGPGPDDLAMALVELARTGWRRAVVKTVIPKYAFAVIDLAGRLDYGQARRRCEEALGWALVHLDGVPGAFAVQGFVPMTDEYRLFVVGGEVVTGAGCIEEHTPLQNEAPFDAKLRSVRSLRSPVRRDPARRDRLVELGTEVAGALASEQPGLDEYVLDVAFVDDAPVIVELNGLDNAGLYACDPYRLATARVAWRHARACA